MNDQEYSDYLILVAKSKTSGQRGDPHVNVRNWLRLNAGRLDDLAIELYNSKTRKDPTNAL